MRPSGCCGLSCAAMDTWHTFGARQRQTLLAPHDNQPKNCQPCEMREAFFASSADSGLGPGPGPTRVGWSSFQARGQGCGKKKKAINRDPPPWELQDPSCLAAVRRVHPWHHSGSLSIHDGSVPLRFRGDFQMLQGRFAASRGPPVLGEPPASHRLSLASSRSRGMRRAQVLLGSGRAGQGRTSDIHGRAMRSHSLSWEIRRPP